MMSSSHLAKKSKRRKRNPGKRKRRRKIHQTEDESENGRSREVEDQVWHYDLEAPDDENVGKLDAKVVEMHKSNPHLRQINQKVLVNQESHDQGVGSVYWTRQYRLLSRDAPREVYTPRSGQHRSTLHWGQRKLLMAEMEFLTQYASASHLGAKGTEHANVIVLYCGAAPGTHIKFLAGALFSHCRFVLVDPNMFDPELVNQHDENVEIINGYFDDALAYRYSNMPDGSCVLFISDVRTGSHMDMTFDENEQFIAQDMVDQMRWHQILRPHKSLLKFRLPYVPGKTPYLDGDLYLPVWGAQSTTECRLVPFDSGAIRIYDHAQHWEQMFFFNTRSRVSYYEHNVLHGDGLDHCYDCISEIHILRKYLASILHDSTDHDVSELSKEISHVLSPSGNRMLSGETPLRLENISLPFLADMHRRWRTQLSIGNGVSQEQTHLSTT